MQHTQFKPADFDHIFNFAQAYWTGEQGEISVLKENNLKREVKYTFKLSTFRTDDNRNLSVLVNVYLNNAPVYNFIIESETDVNRRALYIKCLPFQTNRVDVTNGKINIPDIGDILWTTHHITITKRHNIDEELRGHMTIYLHKFALNFENHRMLRSIPKNSRPGIQKEILKYIYGDTGLEFKLGVKFNNNGEILCDVDSADPSKLLFANVFSHSWIRDTAFSLTDFNRIKNNDASNKLDSTTKCGLYPVFYKYRLHDFKNNGSFFHGLSLGQRRGIGDTSIDNFDKLITNELKKQMDIFQLAIRILSKPKLANPPEATPSQAHHGSHIYDLNLGRNDLHTLPRASKSNNQSTRNNNNVRGQIPNKPNDNDKRIHSLAAELNKLNGMKSSINSVNALNTKSLTTDTHLPHNANNKKHVNMNVKPVENSQALKRKHSSLLNERNIRIGSNASGKQNLTGTFENLMNKIRQARSSQQHNVTQTVNKIPSPDRQMRNAQQNKEKSHELETTEKEPLNAQQNKEKMNKNVKTLHKIDTPRPKLAQIFSNNRLGWTHLPSTPILTRKQNAQGALRDKQTSSTTRNNREHKRKILRSDTARIDTSSKLPPKAIRANPKQPYKRRRVIGIDSNSE